MLENNDDFENFDKNFPQEDENIIINNEDNNTEEEVSDYSETTMEDIFSNIPPMPSDYEDSIETETSSYNSSQEDNETVMVQPVKFASFDDAKSLSGDAAKNLDNLLDIKLQLTVELGRTTLPVKKVLELTRGSIVELEKIQVNLLNYMQMVN